MQNGMERAVCPRCGSSAEVRTVQELFDLLNSVEDDAMQQAERLREKGPDQGPPQQDSLISDQSPRSSNPDQELADAVLATTTRFVGRALRKRAKQRASKGLDAMSEHAQNEREQVKIEQAAIIERYPDLRGCLKDQILFLSDGNQAMPIGDISMPITLKQVDEIVHKLRAS